MARERLPFGLGEANETKLESAGSGDIFIVKYDANGGLAWAKRAGGISDDYGIGIVVDGLGDIYVTGTNNGESVTFGEGEANEIILKSSGTNDVFVAKYSEMGSIHPDQTDVDGDGFSPAQGDCNAGDKTIFPGAIDICGDGIDQDCNGSDLSCLTASFGTDEGQVIIATISDGTISLQDANVAIPENLDFIYTPMDIAITNIPNGTTIDFTIDFPSPVPNEASVYKLIDGAWVNFDAYCQFNPQRTSITFQITDGGYGDNDHAVDGQISDPIGLANSVQNSSNNSGDSGSSGGSCFISSIFYYKFRQ